mgnify:FL=1
MITQTSFNFTDTPKKEYNGWSDWTTWNCALWIGNDQGLYNMARNCVDYIDFINNVIDFLPKTPDGAIWDEADVFEMNEMMAEL